MHKYLKEKTFVQQKQLPRTQSIGHGSIMRKNRDTLEAEEEKTALHSQYHLDTKRRKTALYNSEVLVLTSVLQILKQITTLSLPVVVQFFNNHDDTLSHSYTCCNSAEGNYCVFTEELIYYQMS